MDLQLTGRVALVMAASKGLGAATARQFAREGARVVICARGEEVHQTAADIRAETGAEVLAVQGDVTQSADMEQLIERVVEQFGGIDILITNSGGPPPGLFEHTTLDQWESASNLLLLSTVRLIQLALPHLRQSEAAAILTITSASTKQPIQNLVLSNSVRLAVVGLTKTLSQELAGDRIRVNSILPGWTYTGRVDQLVNNRAQQNGTTPETEIAAIASNIPMQRMGTPEEFANAAVFLCSPAAGYINGVMLPVDGGLCQGSL
ncbi:MAG: SDR family oxidoreductase [Elainellaceae cyanobacterium]